MLSVGKIVVGQHRYYQQQVAQGVDDYYSGRGEAPGWWTGSGAEALGLDGRASAEQFHALIAGMDPREPSVRLRSSPRDPDVAALDLTFSAPKSASVLAALAPDAVRQAMVQAHDEAVVAALSYLEDAAVQVRRGAGGERVEAGEGLIAVAYRHRMSRALDPQLHTHVVAANLARGWDGRFTALHGTPLYRAAKTAGFLYQAHLRAAVSERLGLEWGEVRNGAAELTAVPATVLAGFSQRRQEMERAALAGGIGLGSKAAAQAAALATRERKQYGIDTHTWLEEVRARAGELGLGRDELRELANVARDRLVRGIERVAVDEQGLGDRLVGPLGLTERANAFDERAVLQAFAGAAGQGAFAEDVRGQGVRFTQRPDVLLTARGQLTTTDLVASEERLIDAAVGRTDAAVGVLELGVVEAVIAGSSPLLTSEQADIVRAVSASGRGVEVVEALAGTGKTTTAGVLRAVYEDAGYAVLGVAPTGRGGRELTEQAGIAARTLDRLLIDIEQFGDALPARCVVVFDEAGMAPTRTTARLLEAAERAGAKVIAIGDPGQLASIQAGGWLRAVGRQVGALRLTQAMRQRDPAERRALGALHDRLPKPYLEWAARTGRIDTFADPAQARERAVAEWADTLASVGPGQAVLIARDNDTRDALNQAARAHRRAHGELGAERSYGPVELAVGDRVICRRNDRLLDVDNGTRGSVRHLDEHRVVIETDSHLTRELPAGYVAEHVEHAYALTGHGMQGATVEHAIVVASPRELTAGWSYTALSRARRSTRLLIHDDHTDHARLDIAPTAQATPTGREELIARAARRMLERDDEDLAIDQLHPAGHADDHELRTLARGEPIQEHAGLRAEPAVEDISPERLRSLHEHLRQLTAQRDALPIDDLRQLDELDARIVEASTNREQTVAALARVPPPTLRLIRSDRDPHLVDRHRLQSHLEATDRQLAQLADQRASLTAELGDPAQVRSEVDGFDRAITTVAQEQRSIRDRLIEQELTHPGPWANRTFGERPTNHRAEDWERAVRRVTAYRLEHDVTDQDRPLGLAPPAGEDRQEWQRAHRTVEQQMQLGHDRSVELDLGLE